MFSEIYCRDHLKIWQEMSLLFELNEIMNIKSYILRIEKNVSTNFFYVDNIRYISFILPVWFMNSYFTVMYGASYGTLYVLYLLYEKRKQ